MATDQYQSNGQPTFDPVKQQLATVYARALLGAAEEAGQTDAVVEEVGALVRELLDAYPRLEAVWSSASIPPEEKVGMIDRILAGRVNQLVLNFLKVLAKNGRLDCLRAVRGVLERLHDELRGRVRVKMTTAVPLDEPLIGQLSNQLRARLRAEPKVDVVIDPEMIGGLMLRVGDTVYDGSVRSELRRLRSQMIDRSVHEIQSRRDRFRNSE